MKVMVVCSTAFYDKIASIKLGLEQNGHQVITPNCYDESEINDDTSTMTDEEYLEFFRYCYYQSREKIPLSVWSLGNLILTALGPLQSKVSESDDSTSQRHN